tara:strand:- start:87 stop:311 length:225 start_codon:yes stop_codon:yes gene_type:complete
MHNILGAPSERLLNFPSRDKNVIFKVCMPQIMKNSHRSAISIGLDSRWKSAGEFTQADRNFLLRRRLVDLKARL